MTDLFADFALPIDRTAKCYIANPATKVRLKDADGNECYIEMHGYHSQPAQTWRNDREEKLRTLGREFTPDENEDDLGEMLARLTVDWQLIAPTGNKIDVPCTYENAKKLFTSAEHRWMRQQVIDWLSELKNFLPPSWIN